MDSESPASPVGSDRPWESRGARKEWWLVGFLIGAVALVGMGLLLGDRQRVGQSTLSGAEGRQSGGSGVETDPEPGATLGAASLSVPPGLEGVAQRSAELVVQRYQAAADSIRRAQGVSAAPPRQWLSGNYLANAGDFPEVPQFWSAYGRFVEELRVSDRTLFLDALSPELGPRVAEPEQLPALEGYLRDRYAVTFPGRQELHDQLASVAGAALDLHEFLVGRSEAIQFTPALGTGAVARDPVLEVRTEDPEVQRELELHLDQLFQALGKV